MSLCRLRLRCRTVSLFMPNLLASAITIALGALASTTHAEEKVTPTQSPIPSMEVIKVVGIEESHSFQETGSVVLIDLEQSQRIQHLATEDVNCCLA